MNLMQLFVDASDESAVSKIDGKVRLDAASTRNLMGQLAPELPGNASDPDLIFSGQMVRTPTE